MAGMSCPAIDEENKNARELSSAQRMKMSKELGKLVSKAVSDGIVTEDEGKRLTEQCDLRVAHRAVTELVGAKREYDSASKAAENRTKHKQGDSFTELVVLRNHSDLVLKRSLKTAPIEFRTGHFRRIAEEFKSLGKKDSKAPEDNALKSPNNSTAMPSPDGSAPKSARSGDEGK